MDDQVKRLWIWIPSIKRWESHDSATEERRAWVKETWQRLGYAVTLEEPPKLTARPAPPPFGGQSRETLKCRAERKAKFDTRRI